MDLQTVLDNAMAASRAKEMIDSEQLMLGELLLKLETVSDKKKDIVFDSGKYKPISLDSWRGSYCEIAIEYETTPLKKLMVQDLINMLELARGKSFTGYKGGDFTMGKSTPIWVANYGESSGFIDYDQAVVDIKETKKNVSLITKRMDY